MSPHRRRPGRRGPGSALLAGLASLAVHATGYALLAWTVSLPDTGIELALPASVEIGLVDIPPPAQPPPDAPAAAAPPSGPSGPSQAAAHARPAERQKRRRRAGPDGAARRPDAGPRQAPDAGSEDPATQDAGLHAWQPRSPEGALVSLRIDMSRVRASTLADDVGAVVRALPDVQGLLSGSGVDPVEDLSRLLVASPDLSRKKALIAGQHVGDPTLPRRAAGELARLRGATATFRRHQGLAVAPWHSPDGTPRTLALLGKQRFVIARGQDLPRVMALARLWSARRPDAGTSEGEALLALPSGAALQAQVEGVHHFVRRSEVALPTTVNVLVDLSDDPGATVIAKAELSFSERAEAAEAVTALRDLLAEYGRHPLLAITGLAGALQGTRVSLQRRDTPSGARSFALVQTTLGRLQAQTVLGMLRDATVAPPPTTGAKPAPARRGNLPGTPGPAGPR